MPNTGQPKGKAWKRKGVKDSDKLLPVPGAKDTDVIIAVMGPPGAGKSTFINTAAGDVVTPVGGDLDSCTSEILPVIVPHPGDPARRIIFVDTPAFDDTYIGDTEILRRIAVWMAYSYNENMKLAGAIYLHEISQTRMLGSSRKNFVMFSRLVGNKAARAVVLAATKWSEVVEDVAKRRQQQLSATYWKNMLDQGSQICQFRNTYESAWKIINVILQAGGIDALLIQDELVNLQKGIPMTEAGKALHDPLPESRNLKSLTDRVLLELSVSRGPCRSLISTIMATEANKTAKNGDKIRKQWDIRESDHVPVPGAKDTDVIIPVMGPTGAGKSTFINTAAGTNATPVGNDLDSCTSEILPVIVPHPDDPTRRIIFVDTPGLNNTFIDDTEILRRIAVWLAYSYDKNMKLAGVIYLHEISQTRTLEISLKNFVFNRLAGDQAANVVVLVTTKWDEVVEDVGKRREQQLSETRWKNMLDQGSHICQFRNTHESAWKIVNVILQADGIDAVPFQCELVNLPKHIPVTEASNDLRNTLQKLLNEQKELAGRMKKVSQECKELRKRHEEVDRQLRFTVEQIQYLKVPLVRRMRAVFFP